MIEIRPIKSWEISLLRQMAIDTQLEAFGELNTPENMEAFIQKTFKMDQLTNECKEPGSIYYMAWDGEQPAGFLRLRANPEAEKHLGKNAIELQRIYVLKKFLGKKIGFQLIQTALAHARKNKFEWIWLGVWEKNPKAYAFYKRLGFERFSEHIFWMGPEPQTDWLLKLKL